MLLETVQTVLLLLCPAGKDWGVSEFFTKPRRATDAFSSNSSHSAGSILPVNFELLRCIISPRCQRAILVSQPRFTNLSATPPALFIENLSYRYRSRQESALQNVTFNAQSGEVILVAGASGCGKTTLMRAIVGVQLVASALMILLRYVINNPVAFDQFGPMLLGVFPLVVMFVVTSVATLRERTPGTLEG